MIIREAFKSIAKSKLITLTIILQLVITSVVCNLVIEKISSMNKDWNTFDQTYTQKNYYWIVENIFNNDLEQKFWSSDNSFERIKNYYKDMANSEDYKYLEMCKQEITIQDKDSVNQKFIPVGNFSVNLQCLNEFGIKTIEGRLFTEDEMNISLSTQTLPILLGYNLKDKYKIGDSFEGTYFPKKIKYKVIGVLEKNSHLIKTNIQEDGNESFYFEYLDSKFVTPLVNCEEAPTNDKERFFERILYQMKLNATIATPPKYNAGEIRNKIDTLAAKYDMYDFEVIWISNDKLDLLKLVSKGSIDIMAILAIILFIFSLASIWASISVKIEKNIGDYAIHLLIGARRKTIIMYLITEIGFILFVSHVLSIAMTKIIFTSQVSYTINWIVISIVACIGACIYPTCRILRNKVDILLQGDSYE